MNVPIQNLYAMRGDTWSKQLTFTLVSGTIAGASIWFTIKRTNTEVDPGELQLTVGSGIVIDDGTHATVTITPAQAAALSVASLYYDVQILLPSGVKNTTQRGRFIVVRDTTLA